MLRYDKTGIGTNYTLLDANVYGNATFTNLKQDAEKALAVLAQQPEVDTSKITIIGHSEGTMVAPRVAIDNPTKVKNIALLGAVAQDLKELLYFQVVNKPLLYAETFLDHNHDGSISVFEATKNPVFSSMVGNITLLLTQNNGTTNKTAFTQQLNPNYNTNKDAYISINNELKPKLIEKFNSYSIVTPGKKCTETGACPIWLRSHLALEPTLNIIGNVPPITSILIQQGQNDSQTSIQQAFLLQQELIDKKHPDHRLITYPNLGHAFYPSSEWVTSVAGPIQPYVLSDLYSWLEANAGFTNIPASIPSSSSTNSTSK